MPYVPPPNFKATELDDLKGEILGEFEKVAQALSETEELELRPRNSAPKKPRAGMIVHADGTNWNPGAGAGTYEYRGGAWVKL